VSHAQRRLDERVQPLRLERSAELGKESAHEPEMDRTDDIAMFLGGFPEGAVVQQDLPFPASGLCFGCKPDVVEGLDETPGRGAARRCAGTGQVAR